jgi:hypothetical protein
MRTRLPTSHPAGPVASGGHQGGTLKQLGLARRPLQCEAVPVSPLDLYMSYDTNQ